MELPCAGSPLLGARRAVGRGGGGARGAWNGRPAPLGLHPGRPGFPTSPPALWGPGLRGSPSGAADGSVKSARYPCGCDSGEGNGAEVKECFPVLDQPLRSLEELPFGHDCGSGACDLNTLLLLVFLRLDCPV